MSDKSAIEWTDATFNPVTGCTKVSEGCRNCYALKFAERFRGTPGHYFEHGFDVILRHDKLELPLTWKKPKKIFVNSMSDLFHKDIPDEYILAVFSVMAEANWHTFQLLTKRPQRMHDLLADIGPKLDGMVYNGHTVSWPLPNVWLGVSVENQQAADERIPSLLQTPAVVRFLSCEPLLGPVDLEWPDGSNKAELCCNGYECGCQGMPVEPPLLNGIDWVIVGGESGPNARPMHPEWARSLRDQCQRWKVPFFFKQWGEWLPNAQEYGADPGDFNYERKHVIVGDIPMCKAGKKTAGRLLDGRTWDEFPAVQR